MAAFGLSSDTTRGFLTPRHCGVQVPGCFTGCEQNRDNDASISRLGKVRSASSPPVYMSEILLDPRIFKMKTCAEGLIESGDEAGYLALYWIICWIKNARTVIERDELGRKLDNLIPVMVHPDNFAWYFNSTAELGTNTHSFLAIEKVYELSA